MANRISITHPGGQIDTVKVWRGTLSSGLSWGHVQFFLFCRFITTFKLTGMNTEILAFIVNCGRQT
ncbi:hypothetical protein L210DRAFT_125938 [Boletus edulis BED1]|uniref:Uncharacterized protein n=1 Tax=Boletus edulis BED1 TaxID=1328754 RepID=A0AAD4GBV4_BOLED|nr:hypothetical protein L210DRAFT_125938 [Boletus edulis BED1]